VTVRNPQSFDTSVDGKNVGYMSIVEPKPRCAHQYSPVISVITLEEIIERLLRFCGSQLAK